jgi:hypothetical protein
MPCESLLPHWIFGKRAGHCAKVLYLTRLRRSGAILLDEVGMLGHCLYTLPHYIADIRQVVIDELRIKNVDQRIVTLGHDVLANEDIEPTSTGFTYCRSS